MKIAKPAPKELEVHGEHDGLVTFVIAEHDAHGRQRHRDVHAIDVLDSAPPPSQRSSSAQTLELSKRYALVAEMFLDDVVHLKHSRSDSDSTCYRAHHASLPAAVLLAACASPEGKDLEEKKQSVLKMEENALAQLHEEQPDTVRLVENSHGYAVFKQATTKVPLVGAGGGYGVVTHNETGEKTFMKIRRFEFGGGYGAKTFRIIFVFTEREALEKFLKAGFETAAGAEASAGSAAGGGETGAEGTKTYVLADKGASATVTVKVLRYKRVGSMQPGEPTQVK